LITAEAPAGQPVPQDGLGGADRGGDWLTVADGVPCLVRPMDSALMAFGGARDDARRNVITARIYFGADPVPEGISTRHRITITSGTVSTQGVYAVQGTINPNSMDLIFQVDCERIRGQ